jgi:hypothetical protein
MMETKSAVIMRSTLSSRHYLCLWSSVAVVLGIAAGTVSCSVKKSAESPTAAKCQNAVPNLPSFFDLLSKSPHDLERVDVAEMNLLCAQGLPGAEKLDIRKYLKMLDEWAEKVRFNTQRYYYKFSQHRMDYDDSEGEYRMMMLITVLQQDYGVHYSEERILNADYTNAKDLFIHGMINDGNGGTCVCMPVLYAAVARRLGWPVKLALAKGHVFCRWEDDKERFNIEGSSRGFHRRDDDHFKKWPHPISDEEVKAGIYLVSLAPSEELAAFLAVRGHCLEDNGRLAEALVAYSLAHQLAPKSPEYLAFLADAVRKARSRPLSPHRPAGDVSTRSSVHRSPAAESVTRLPVSTGVRRSIRVSPFSDISWSNDTNNFLAVPERTCLLRQNSLQPQGVKP